MPKAQVVVLNWAVADVDWDQQLMNATAMLPTELPAGEYFVFLTQAEIIQSGPITVSPRSS